MAKFRVYERMAPFGANRSFIGRKLAVPVAESQSPYKMPVYKALGEFNLTLSNKRQWIPTNMQLPGAIMTRQSFTVSAPPKQQKPAITKAKNVLKAIVPPISSSKPTVLKQSSANMAKVQLPFSGGVTFGKNQNNAIIPLIIASGAVLFFLLSGGNLRLGGRRGRRR